MKVRATIVVFLVVAAALATASYAGPFAPRAAGEPSKARSSAPPYRTVYLGALHELTSYLFPLNTFDDQIVYQAIKWASGKEVGPYSILLVDCIETNSWGYWPVWTNFMSRHPDVVATWTEADPVTYADYALGLYDVLFIGNAWHGDPAAVPPPNPGAKSWVFTDQELADIKQYVSEGHGLIVTGGSFGQFARNTALGYNNYKLASFMCLQSTGGGDAAVADAFPWSRNSGPYPPTRPPSASPITLFNDAPTHPIMTGIPASYVISPNNAMAQWMQLIPTAGGVMLAHYGLGTQQFTDSMITACEVRP